MRGYARHFPAGEELTHELARIVARKQSLREAAIVA
jgi:hypothetical protein